MMQENHVLVAIANPFDRNLVHGSLGEQGFRSTPVEDPASVRQLAERADPDLAVLDRHLPPEDGLALARRLRASNGVPAIVLLPRNTAIERALALEGGADDCLGRPFNLRELIARVRNVLRRTGRASALSRSPAEGEYISFAGRRLYVHVRRLFDEIGAEIALTGAEFDILALLAGNANRIVTREEIAASALRRTLSAEDRSIDVHVGHLRRKLEVNPRKPDLIRSVRGRGYILTGD
jgi:two-component system phosphate regulon response regulator OmpR